MHCDAIVMSVTRETCDLQGLAAGHLVEVHGTDVDYYGYVATGLVIEVRRLDDQAAGDEVLVMINSKPKWFDTKYFIFIKLGDS